MSDTIDRTQEIEELIKGVTVKRKAGMPILQFLDRYSRFTGQIDVDKEKLIATGYDWNIAERDIALFPVLSNVHAERTAAEGKGASSIRRMAMEKKAVTHEILKLITQHVRDETNDDTIKIAYSKIVKGDSHMDTLHDILAMANLLKEHQDVATTFTPDGVVANEEYLDRISKETQELLELNGIPTVIGNDRAQLVDKQERVITLCMDAIDRMRKFGRGAFFRDKEYFKKYYTYRDSHKHEKDESIEELDTPVEDVNPLEGDEV